MELLTFSKLKHTALHAFKVFKVNLVGGGCALISLHNDMSYFLYAILETLTTLIQTVQLTFQFL